MIGAIGGHGSDMLQMWKDKIAAADADASGGLSLDEFTKLGESGKTAGTSKTGAPDPADLFAKLDGDGDGQLSTEELKPPPPPPPPGGAKVGGAAMSMLLGMQEDDEDADAASVSDLVSKLASQLVDAADTDGDGVVSAAEFAAQAQSANGGADEDAFTSADADQDGSLSSTELGAQLQDLLSQQLQAGGRKAYDQMLDVFSKALTASSDQAKTSSTLDLAA